MSQRSVIAKASVGLTRRRSAVRARVRPPDYAHLGHPERARAFSGPFPRGVETAPGAPTLALAAALLLAGCGSKAWGTGMALGAGFALGEAAVRRLLRAAEGGR